MLQFKERDLARARPWYRALDLLPRFRGNVVAVTLFQTMLVMASPAANLKVRLRGLRAEYRKIQALGRTARVRIIHPRGASRGILFDIHGGGWVTGIPGQNDALNVPVLRECGMTIVSPDYRLVRPGRISIDASVDDCETAAVWLLEESGAEFGSRPVVMSGDSAGAHLAACTLVRLRERGGAFPRIRAAVLRYGIYDFSGTPSVRAAGAKTLILDGPAVLGGLASLSGGLDETGLRAPSLSPLYADLHGLPPALFLAGDRDALRDDSVLMAARWREAGNLAEIVVVPEAPHAFDRFPTSIARQVSAHVRDWVSHFLA